MKTVRFSKLVEIAGRPEPHLLLSDPDRDSVLKRAMKDHRVVTVHQTILGAKADYGTVGFVKKDASQVLIFPKSVSRFEEQHVVGIKYDLLDPGKKFRARVVKPPRVSKPSLPGKTKIVEFPAQLPRQEKPVDSLTLANLKRQVRGALKSLESGNSVKAYNLLKEAVKD